MRNKKMIVFNAVIFLLFISVVFIGKTTWGKPNPKKATSDETEKNQEAKRFNANPALSAHHFMKKMKADLKNFGHELEIIELEEEEVEGLASEEEPVQEVHQAQEHARPAVTESRQRTTQTTANPTQTQNSSRTGS